MPKSEFWNDCLVCFGNIIGDTLYSTSPIRCTVIIRIQYETRSSSVKYVVAYLAIHFGLYDDEVTDDGKGVI